MKLSINYLLRTSNLLLFLFLIILLQSNYSVTQNYINNLTIAYGLLLCLSEIFFINKNKYINNPFSYVLSFFTLLGFSSRILTLGFFNFSPAFWRFNYSVIELNHFILFIIISNMIMHYLFIKTAIKIKKISKINLINLKPNNLILFLGTLIFVNFGPFFKEVAGIQLNLISIVYIFLDPRLYWPFFISTLVFYSDKITLNKKIIIFFLFLVEFLFGLSCGSRSGIPFLLIILFLFTLNLQYIEYKLTFKRSIAFILIFASCIYAFSIGSQTRNFGCRTVVFPKNETAQELYKSTPNDSYSYLKNISSFIPFKFYDTTKNLAARLGFLDYGYDMYANADIYKNYVNFSAYSRSFVDNIITPGFDIYDQPKIENVIPFIYNFKGDIQPKKSLVGQHYSSDMMTIYGEFFIFWNYFSLIIFAFMSIVLNKIYYKLRKNDSRSVLLSFFVLSIFADLILNFGIDTILIKYLILIVAYFIFNFFSFSKNA